jgi:hypothetical protein
MATTSSTRPYRRHRLRQEDGTSLVLRTDGTITSYRADGTVEQTWPVDDDGWATQLLRFGIQPGSSTVKPGRPAPVTRPAPR